MNRRNVLTAAAASAVAVTAVAAGVANAAPIAPASETYGARFSDGTFVPMEPLDDFCSRYIDAQVDHDLDGIESRGVTVDREAYKQMRKKNLIDFIPTHDGRKMWPLFMGAMIFIPGTVYDQKNLPV